MKQTDEQKAATLARRAAHFAALEQLHNNDRDKTPTGRIRAQKPKPSGRSLWLRLRRIETRAHNAATAQCNGAAYQGEPFRPDHMPDGRDSEGDEMTPYETFLAEVRADVARVLGGIPAGFFVNGDPRGYALKIRTARCNDGVKDVAEALPPGLCTDWGGYGILAAEID